MKNSRNSTTRQSKQGMSHKPKPEIRDDLDSRKEKESNSNMDKKVRGRKKNN